MKEMTVVKRISFDAAHYLPDYPGKCKNMHGHHWVVELGVKGPVGKDGIVVDFAKLKDFLHGIEAAFDHSLVNDIIDNPTAENISLHIKNEFMSWLVTSGLCEYDKDRDGDFKTWRLSKGVGLDFIKVWETEDSYAELH